MSNASDVATPQAILQCAAQLRRNRERLLERPVASIIAALDRVSEAWLDPGLPERQETIDRISAHSGASTAMVAHAIDLEMRSSRADDLRRALERELGDPAALDGFVPVPALRGRSHAVGPGLIGAVFSANIPALPHLTVMRALLVKSACLGRTSADEPFFLPLYLRTLTDVDPEIGACVASVHWPHDDRACEAAFLGAIDHLIAYGSDAALAALRDRAPSGLPATWHGHRLGFAVVLRDALTRSGPPALTDALARDGLSALTDALARDFSVFDQHACLSPQAVYVEKGGPISPVAFAEALASAMDRWLERLPARRLDPGALAWRRGLVGQLELRDAMGGPRRLLSDASHLQGVVTIEPAGPLEPTPLDRFVRVMVLERAEDLLPLLAPARGRLQNVALAGSGARAGWLKLELARLGCSRICRPGRMATPSMMWYHDGVPRLGELVRWCDEEDGPV